MKKTLVACFLLTFVAIFAHAKETEVVAGATAVSRVEAIDTSKELLKGRVDRACASRGGLAEGIAPAICDAYPVSTGKWNGSCEQKIRCKKP